MLGKRSRSLVSWNESFWAGAGIFAAVLIVLSRLSSSAVTILGAALPVLMIVAIVLRWTRGTARPVKPSEDFRHFPQAAIPLGMATCVVLVFAALNARTGFVTDGFSIWLSKARVLSLDGHLDQSFRQPELLGRVAAYPPLVSLSEALLGRGAGEFDYPAAKTVFPVFMMSLLVGTYGAARRLLPRSLSIWAPAIVGLLPWVSTDWNAGGFADLPMAAAVATMVGAWLGRVTGSDLHPSDAWIAGSALMIKPEGAVIVCCLAFVTLAFFYRRGRPVAAGVLAILPLAGFASLVILYWRWFGVTQGQYGPIDAAHVAVAVRRIPEVIAGCAEMAFSWQGWGIFWIVGVGGAAIALARGSRATRALSTFVVMTSVIFAAIFLFTNWEFPGLTRFGTKTVAFHMRLAFPRLLEQISGPAAAVCSWSPTPRSPVLARWERSRRMGTSSP